MKKNKIWKKIISHLLTATMLVSLFAGVDMGWNVMEVQAASYSVNFENASNCASNDVKVPAPDYRGYQGSGAAKSAKENDIITFKNNQGYDRFKTFTLYIQDGDGPLTKYKSCNTSEQFTYQVPQYKAVDNFYLSGNDICELVLKLKAHAHTYAGQTCETGGTCACGATADPLGHSYGTPTYTWSEDGQTCTATRTCGRDTNHKETETATITSATITSVVTIAATCTAVGTTTYTATFTNSAFSTQTKDVLVPASGHNFNFTAGDNVITATCQNTGVSCPHNATGITLTLTANDATYTGSPYTGASISDWSASADGLAAKPTDITYTNKEGTAEYNSTTAPTNVGDYTASITVDGVTATKDFSITKKEIATSDVDITRDDATYNGEAKAAVVTGKTGLEGMGDITVKYQKKSGETWDEETEDAPVNAGTYQVVAHISGGDNFNESYVAVKEFTISKATPSIATAPSFINTITYGTILSDIELGADGVATYNGNEIPGTFAWKIGTTKPIVADSNTTNFAIEFTPDDSENYNSCEINVKLTTVNPAEPEAPSAGVGYKIDYVNETLKADPVEDFEVSSTDGETATSLDADTVEPGQTYYVRYKANDNQKKSDWTSIDVDSRPAKPADSVVVERLDTSITLQMIPGVEYSLNGTDWFTTSDTNVTVADNKITFSGLAADTNCTVYSRVKATNDEPTPHFHSDNTTQVIKTKKSLPGSLATLFTYTAPNDLTYSKTAKFATVEKASGYSAIGELVAKYYDSTGNEVENPINVGTYTVKVSAPATEDYPAVPETVVGTFAITKKAITITPDAGQSKVYGTSDPVITYTPSEALFTGDTFTGALTYTGASVNANVKNDYPIVIGTLSAGDNYELTLTPGVTFEITKATYTSGPAKNIGYSIDYVAETMTVTDTDDFELSSTETEVATALVGNKVTPGETYYIRYKANDNQESSPWTAITLPARPAAPNAVGKQETVENKKDAEITGVNSTMEYKFDGVSGWTAVTDTKIPNPDNKNISIRIKASNDNKNFYGLEKNITFTASTAKLKVRLGDTIVEVPYGGTVDENYKPEDPTPPTGQVFLYWAFGGEEWKFDDPDDSSDDATASKVTGNITLVPVFGVEIHGTITAADYDSITEVSLVDGKGNGYNHHDLTDNGDGTYTYSVIAPAGVDYNLVIEGKKTISGTAHDITKTQLVNLKQGGNGDISMPAGVFNSKVTKASAGEFENTLVGGLDEIADSHEGSTDVVTVELTVSATVVNDSEITTAVTGKTLDFVELTLTKTTNGGTPENIGNANDKLLEIIVPYNTSGKYSIAVYRYHDSKVDTISTTKNADGEYIEIGTDTITIHAKKFSTYAIGYSLTAPSSGSKTPDKAPDDGSNDSGSTPTEPKKEAPTEKKPQGTTPKQIVKDTTPKAEDKEEIKSDSPSLDTSDKEKTEDDNLNKDEEGTIRVSVEEKDPSKEAKDAIEKFIEKGKIPFDTEGGKSVEVGMHFGKTISIKVVKTLANGEEVEVTDWDGKMTVTVDIPKDLVKAGRNYYVIAYVNGEAKKIPVTVNADNTITFDAEEGAEYAICYIDESEIPHATMDQHNGKHNLLWLYLLLLVIFAVARIITKDKTNPVKIALIAGDAVVAGLLLLVVKVCTLSIIVCLAEIAVSVAIHLVMGRKAE